MNRERIADDIYVFSSQRYAQVTAGAILTKQGVVLVDTLFFPDETLAIKTFLEQRLGQHVRYIINTHYHADHTQGTYLFPRAEVISHTLCRQLLDSIGREGLAATKASSPDFNAVEVVLPTMVFETGIMTLRIGGKTLQLRHMPGHSLDMLSVFVLEDRVLFASDNMMPVPTFFDGDLEALERATEQIRELKPDSVVQGHGEVILRGEIEHILKDNLSYLACIRQQVTELITREAPKRALDSISIESCGKSRIPLYGLVIELHKANLESFYYELHHLHGALQPFEIPS